MLNFKEIWGWAVNRPTRLLLKSLTDNQSTICHGYIVSAAQPYSILPPWATTQKTYSVDKKATIIFNGGFIDLQQF